MLGNLARGVSLAMVVGTLACGSDDVTGPDDVTFPTISQSALDAACIRGTAAPTTTVNGSISDTDCLNGTTLVGAGPNGYFEGWRVRVATAASVTFTVDSNYDSFLDLFLIDDLGSAGLMNLLDFDDDGGPGDDAELTASLAPDTEYWIMVSGFEAIDVGQYSLDIRGK